MDMVVQSGMASMVAPKGGKKNVPKGTAVSTILDTRATSPLNDAPGV
jgi:hypothetical protein